MAGVIPSSPRFLAIDHIPRKMPVADCKTEPFYVPTIDVAPFLNDPNGPGCDEIISEVRRACLSTGFFQITGHGVPKSLQQSLFDSAANFCAFPFEEKMKLDATKTVGHRGYNVLASQSYEGDVLPDLKEVSCAGPMMTEGSSNSLLRRATTLVRTYLHLTSASKTAAFSWGRTSGHQSRCYLPKT